MVCIQCGGLTKVTNSRHQSRANHVWRRRQCLTCKTIFSTLESPQYMSSWAVSGPDRQLKPFSRDKLYLSVFKSCGHRPDAVDDAGMICDTIIKKLAGQTINGVLPSDRIKQLALVALSRFDKAAGMNYSAYHP